MNFERYNGETDDQLIARIGKMKSFIGTWNDVTDVLNSLLDRDSDESTYRKKFKKITGTRNNSNEDVEIIDILNELPDTFEKISDNKNNKTEQLLSDIINERRELEKERIKIRDERTEYARYLRREARAEAFKSLLEETVQSYVPHGLNYVSVRDVYNTNTTDVVVCITDLHYGPEYNNKYNTYSPDVAKERLTNYLNQLIDIQRRHDSEKCYLFLGGDLINGIIHTTVRLENNRNVIEQTLEVSELLSDFTYELSKIFSKVNVYSVCGNHGRVNAIKEENIVGENFEVLTFYYMKQKLCRIDNVEFFTNSVDETLGSFEVRGHLVYYAHGNKDDPKTVVQKITQMEGKKPAMVLLGHRHTNALSTVYDTKIIESGCACGTTNYGLDRRLTNRPEQAVAVYGNNGLVCLYDVKLDIERGS